MLHQISEPRAPVNSHQQRSSCAIKMCSGRASMKQMQVVIMIDEKTLNRPESLRIPPRCPKYRVLARLVNRGGSWISHIMLGAVIAGHPGQTAFWRSRQSRANPSLVPNSGIPCRAGLIGRKNLAEADSEIGEGAKNAKSQKKGKLGNNPIPLAPAGRFLGVTRPLEGQYRPALGSVLVLDNLVHGSVRNITVRLMLDSSLAIVE